MGKIRSNLHTGQYASSVPSDHSHGQVLVESLSLPGITWHDDVNKLSCKTAQKRASGLAVHTSGINRIWL